MSDTPDPLSAEEAAAMRARLAQFDLDQGAASRAARQAQLKPLADLIASPAFAEVEAATVAAMEALAGDPLVEPHLQLLRTGLSRVRMAVAS